jgi:hypothetical protein
MIRLPRKSSRTFAHAYLSLRALPVVLAFRLALTLLPFRHVRTFTLRFAAKRKNPSSPPPAAIARAVQSAARLVPSATCLTQALAAHLLCTRHGHPTTLRIGISKSPATALRAHAWLDYAGHILVGDLPNLHAFVPLPLTFESHPPAGERVAPPALQPLISQ